MEIQEMLNIAIKTNDKINISAEQLQQLEVFIVAYMSAAKLESSNPELSKQIMSNLDVKWDSLFNVTNK